jgi:hypothetical protein
MLMKNNGISNLIIIRTCMGSNLTIARSIYLTQLSFPREKRMRPFMPSFDSMIYIAYLS